MLRLGLCAALAIFVSLTTSHAHAQRARIEVDAPLVLPAPPSVRLAPRVRAGTAVAEASGSGVAELQVPIPEPGAGGFHAHASFVFTAPIRFGHEVLLGFTNMDPAVHGSTFAVGWSADFAVVPWLALGLRIGWSMTPDVGLDADGDGLDDNREPRLHLLSATTGPRFRIPTAPEGNDAFVLEIGAGYALIVDERRPSGAVLDIAISRWGDAGGFGGGPIVRLQQGLGDAGSLTTVLVGVQGGVDLSECAREPRGRSEFRYTLGWDFAAGGAFLEQGRVPRAYLISPAMTFGAPIADVIEPRVRLDFAYRFDEVRDPLESYALSGGLRVLLDPWIPLYVEAGAGWAFRFGTLAEDVPDGAFLDLGAGARFIDCEGSHVAFTLGVRSRIGLFQSDALTGIQAVIGVEYDSVPPAQRARCISPRPPPSLPEVSSGPRTFEIPLGIALGGVFEARLSPEALPLDALADAGSIEVELVGPAPALANAEAELRAAFAARQLRIDRLTRTPRRNPLVSARITVRP